MKEQADWLLRRYRDRTVPDWRVQAVLQAALDRLVAEHSSLLPELDELRRAASTPLREFDLATDLALHRLAERRFDLAWREIQRAGRELRELRRCASVAAELRQVRSALDGLEALLTPGLTGQPTLRILHRLESLGRAFLDRGEPRQARFVIALLSRQAGLLLARRPDALPAGFEEGLDNLETRGGGRAARIRELGREGYRDLAERLADDLESELSVDDRARRAAQGRALATVENSLAAVRRQAGEVQAALAQWLDSHS
jgi:hypothetical protein